MKINEKRLNAIIAESIKKVLSTKHEYECLNEAKSAMGGMRKNRIVENLKFSYPTKANTIISEGIDFEMDKNEVGGIIVFSTDVNAVEKSSNKIINFIKQKFATIINRFKATEKVDRIANKHELVGWTIGHYFDGRYKAKNGKNFGENSLSIEVVGVSDDKMVEIAEDVCREFEQECVLLRLHNGRVLFVNQD